MKKVLSLVLAVVLAFSTAVTAFAQSFTPAVDKTAVKAGEDVTVTLSFEEALVDVTSFEARLYYNNNLFDYKSNTLNNANGFVTAAPQSDAEGTYMEITHFEMSGFGTVAAGEYGKITFTAKSDISEKQVAEFAARVETGLMKDQSIISTENVKIETTVSPASCDHVGTETETAYTSKGDGNHTVTVTCKKCGKDISTADEACTKGEDGKCVHCGYVFPTAGEDEYTITVNVAPSTVNVTFYGDEDGKTALAAEKVADKGVDGKYHVYEVTVPEGMYSYRAVDTADNQELGGMTFEAPVSVEIGADGKPIHSEQKMTLVRVNYYTTDKKVKAIGDYSIDIYPGKMKEVVTGAQYINNKEQVLTPTLLHAHGNALLYNWRVNLSEELAKDYGVAYAINQIFNEGATTTQNKSFTLVARSDYTITAPEGADVRVFSQIKNFNVEELTTTSENNGNGTVTYKFREAKGDYTYRVSMDGKVTKAGYLDTSKNKDITVTFGESENPESTVNNVDSAILAKRMESSTLVNVNGQNNLSLGVGETFRLRAYRGAWQIINSDTANIMIEPDFNYTVLSGGSHIKMSPAVNRCTGNAGKGEKTNWMDIEGVSEGVAVIEVSYDAIEIGGSTGYTGLYGATDPKRTSLVVINVGGAKGELSMKAVGAGNEWDTEFDTVYSLENTATLNFNATLDGAEPTVQLSTDKGASWKNVKKNSDGTFTASGLVEGNNILKFTTNGKTAYQVVRAAKVTYTVTNQRENAKDIIVGDTVEIKFSGLYQPIAKFSGIYNPGFGQGHKVTYTTSDNAEFVKASGGQYDFITTNKYIVKAIAKGEVKLTGGNVHFNVMGDPEPLGGHRVLTDNGIGANFNAKSTNHIRDIFPDITIEVKEKEEEEQHNWSDPTYTWSSDNSTCTAFRKCTLHAGEEETEKATAVKIVKNATCDAKGEITYTATFTNPAFAKQIKSEEIPATGHKWGKPTYEWSTDHSTLTGKVVCENDSNHVHTEKVNSTAVTENATCEEKGKITYTAEFGENKYGFTTQTAVVENAVLGHDWGETEYTWNSNNSEATAKHTCKRDPSHTETETVNTVYSVVKAATCEEKGEGKFVATFTKFAAAEKTVEIPAIGHKWGKPTYEWSADHSTLTGKVVCENDNNHVHTEDARVTSKTLKEATCTEKGQVEFTAEFGANIYGLEKQIKTIDTPALEHDWGETEYTWNSNNSEATAKHTCKRDPSHTETETVNTVYSVVKAATCEEKGEGKFVATFTKFAAAEKTVEIPAIGHKWGKPTYEWSADHSTLTGKVVCENDNSHVHTEDARVTSKTLKEATCTEKGKVEFTAEFGANIYGFEKQIKAVDTPALEHDWGETEYTWNSNNSEATAKHTCKRDPSHTETETVNTVYSVVKAATCEEKGEGKFVATFTKFAAAEKTVEIPAIGHKWGKPTYEWSADHSTLTGKVVCENDNNHVHTEDARVTSKTLKEATCTEKGQVEFTAEFGANIYGFEKQIKAVDTPALGHKLVHHAAKAATCIAEGSIEYWECTVCKKLYSDKDAKNEVTTIITPKDSKNHVGETELKNAKAATCTESGYTGDTYCKSCGELIEKGKASPVVPHQFGEWIIVKQPTRTEVGEKVRYCKVCNLEQRMEIPRLSDNSQTIHIVIGGDKNKGENNPETGAPAPNGFAAVAVLAAAAVILGKKKRG